MAKFFVDLYEVSAMKNGLTKIWDEKRRKQREKQLSQLLNMATEVKDMGYDYLIVGDEKGYVFERKTLTDMMGSIYGSGGVGNPKNRLFVQLERLKEVSQVISEEVGVPVYPIFISEGNLFQRYKARWGNLSRPQWMGIQLKVAELGVGHVRTQSFSETLILFDVAMKRAGKSSKDFATITVSKELRRDVDEVVGMLMNVKGIGEKKALKLLKKYGSIAEIVALSREHFVKELGEKVGGHLYDVLHKSFDKQRRLM